MALNVSRRSAREWAQMYPTMKAEYGALSKKRLPGGGCRAHHSVEESAVRKAFEACRAQRELVTRARLREIYKKNLPPGLRLTEKLFGGFLRRYSIAERSVSREPLWTRPPPPLLLSG